MGAKKLESLVYKDCSDLPKFNFDKIHGEIDYRWLVVGFTGYNKVEVPKNAEDLFTEILNEYCELVGDNRILDYYELIVDITWLEKEITCVFCLCESLKSLSEIATKKIIIAEINSWDHFNVSKALSYKELIYEVERQIRGLSTKINRKSEQLKEYDDEDEVEKTNTVREQVALEQILNKNRIDIKIISVLEWVELKKLAKGIIAERKKWQRSN